METNAMVSYNRFLDSLGPIKFLEVALTYKHQFKIKDNFLNANSKNFDSITAKFCCY